MKLESLSGHWCLNDATVSPSRCSMNNQTVSHLSEGKNVSSQQLKSILSCRVTSWEDDRVSGKENNFKKETARSYKKCNWGFSLCSESSAVSNQTNSSLFNRKTGKNYVFWIWSFDFELEHDALNTEVSQVQQPGTRSGSLALFLFVCLSDFFICSW